MKMSHGVNVSLTAVRCVVYVHGRFYILKATGQFLLRVLELSCYEISDL